MYCKGDVYIDNGVIVLPVSWGHEVGGVQEAKALISDLQLLVMALGGRLSKQCQHCLGSTWIDHPTKSDIRILCTFCNGTGSRQGIA